MLAEGLVVWTVVYMGVSEWVKGYAYVLRASL